MQLIFTYTLLASAINAPAPELPNGETPPLAYSLMWLTDDGGGLEPEAYQRYQAINVQKPRVLRAALQSPGIAKLAVLQGRKDPEAWLREKLQIKWVKPDVLLIGMNDGPPDQLSLLVDAVANAFLHESIELQRVSRKERMKSFQVSLLEWQQEVDRLRSELNNPHPADILKKLEDQTRSLESQIKTVSDHLNKAVVAERQNLPRASILRKAVSK